MNPCGVLVNLQLLVSIIDTCSCRFTTVMMMIYYSDVMIPWLFKIHTGMLVFSSRHLPSFVVLEFTMH